MNHDGTGAFQCPQSLYDGHQLHAVVGCLGLTPIQAFFVSPLLEKSAPATSPGIPLARAVRPDMYRFCHALAHSISIHSLFNANLNISVRQHYGRIGADWWQPPPAAPFFYPFPSMPALPGVRPPPA